MPPCASAQYLPMFRFRNNHYLDSGADRQYSVAVTSRDQCEGECLKGTMTVDGKTETCKSLDYREATTVRSNLCNLNFWALQSDAQLSQSGEYDYQERICFNGKYK